MLSKSFASLKLHNCMRGLGLFGGASRPNSEHTRSLEVLPLAEMRQLDKLHIAFCTRLQEFEIECPGEVKKKREIHGFHSLQKVELNFCTRFNGLDMAYFCSQLQENWHQSKLTYGRNHLYWQTAQSFRRIQNLNSFEKLELIQFSRNIEEHLSRCIALETSERDHSKLLPKSQEAFT